MFVQKRGILPPSAFTAFAINLSVTATNELTALLGPTVPPTERPCTAAKVVPSGTMLRAQSLPMAPPTPLLVGGAAQGPLTAVCKHADTMRPK